MPERVTGLRLGDDGWLRGAAHVPSRNHQPRPPAAAVCLAVIHGISLPPGEFGGDAVAQLFTNRLNCDAHPYYDQLRDVRVAAHFFIRRGGELMQFVSTLDAAWHAGESRWRGRANCNAFSIGIELEGCDDTPYAAEQYERLAALIHALAARYPDIAVAGHCHIAPRRKTDPGDAFNWQTLFQHIGDEYDGRPSA